MSKVRPLPTERRPVPKPVDRIIGPPEEGATPHKVSTGEDWYSLAIKFMIHETKLMDYNFKTTNPAYVNWYLREYVGCTLRDARGWNWKFSSDAKPGIIWIPPRIIKSKDVTGLPKPPWLGGWGKSLLTGFWEETAPTGPHKTVLTFEIGHLVIAALEMAGAHGALLTAGIVLAPFAAIAAVLGSIGGAHMDGFAIQAKAAARDGYSIGAVLGAKGTKGAFVQHTYMRQHMVDKKLQDVYNNSVAAGFLDGRKLNDVQVSRLFQLLHSRMQGKIPTGDEWSDWSDAQKRSYNEEAARVFKDTYLKP